MDVRHLVGNDTVGIEASKTLGDAARLMTSMGIGALVVEFDDNLQGIITERDVVSACAEGMELESTPVRVWMTPDPDTMDADMSVDEAASWMLAAGYRHMPVVDADVVVGVISIKDVLWALTGPTVT